MCTYEWARALVYVKVDAFSGVSESVTKKKNVQESWSKLWRGME